MKIYVVVLDKVFDAGLSTILDTFGVVKHWQHLQELRQQILRLRW